MSHHTISVAGLGFAYPDGTRALQDVSFEVGHGEAIAVVGANGAGKSTLLMHLNGLLSPTEGTVSIGGMPVVKSTLPEIRRTVGMIFQDPDDQLFMPTVGEDVGFGPLNLGLPPEAVAARVDEALARVGAGHLKERPPYRLSGGEKRAVAIATVLAMEPNLLVMDEPSSGLDPRARRRLIGLLASFRHTRIIATHDLDLAAELCERTLVISGGRLVADAPTRQIFSDDELLAASGLERPFGMQACPVCGAAAVAAAEPAVALQPAGGAGTPPGTGPDTRATDRS
jgi:cobalt/nickel transport system ATP-binding protein